MRITVPEGHAAIVLTDAQAADLQSLLLTVRKKYRGKPEAAVAGEVLLALLEMSL